MMNDPRQMRKVCTSNICEYFFLLHGHTDGIRISPIYVLSSPPQRVRDPVVRRWDRVQVTAETITRSHSPDATYHGTFASVHQQLCVWLILRYAEG